MRMRSRQVIQFSPLRLEEYSRKEFSLSVPSSKDLQPLPAFSPDPSARPKGRFGRFGRRCRSRFCRRKSRRSRAGNRKAETRWPPRLLLKCIGPQESPESEAGIHVGSNKRGRVKTFTQQIVSRNAVGIKRIGALITTLRASPGAKLKEMQLFLECTHVHLVAGLQGDLEVCNSGSPTVDPSWHESRS